MQQRFLALALLLLLGLFSALKPAQPVAGQQAFQSPLVIALQGDFYTWEGGTLVQRTEWGYNEGPVLSPDGQRIAYNSWAQLSVDAMQNGVFFAGAPPSNIWLLNLADNSSQRIADQPSDATLPSNNDPGRNILRGKPAWSPDGQSLAWVELVLPYGHLQLLRHDLSSGQNTVLVSPLPFPFMDGGYYVPSVQWGHSGISYVIGTFTDSAPGFHQIVHLYDAVNGSLMLETVLGSEASQTFVNQVYWAEYAGGEVLAFTYNNRTDLGILDPKTGSLQQVNGQMERYQPQHSNSLTAQLHPQPQSSYLDWSWILVSPSGGALLEIPDYASGFFNRLALSADGQRAAFVDHAVYLWENGSSQMIPGTEAAPSQSQFPTQIVWTPERWRVQTDILHDDGPPSDHVADCALEARLSIGERALVLPGDPNVLRQEPMKGNASPVIGQIPAGGQARVLAGPACGSGINWWFVDYNGTTGWTGEGESGVYWLEGVGCDNSPTTRLALGVQARVIPNTTPNALRLAPRGQGDDTVIGNIPAGAVFTIIGDYQCGDLGRTWWRVDYNGTIGWTAEGEGSTYWIEPVTGAG